MKVPGATEVPPVDFFLVLLMRSVLPALVVSLGLRMGAIHEESSFWRTFFVGFSFWCVGDLFAMLIYRIARTYVERAQLHAAQEALKKLNPQQVETDESEETDESDEEISNIEISPDYPRLDALKTMYVVVQTRDEGSLPIVGPRMFFSLRDASAHLDWQIDELAKEDAAAKEGVPFESFAGPHWSRSRSDYQIVPLFLEAGVIDAPEKSQAPIVRGAGKVQIG